MNQFQDFISGILPPFNKSQKGNVIDNINYA